ncbi:hypothetical protein BJ170DRAFT_715431 [Xylariales sp. AK1849]|nr:hypothetical protein BJ170DRAFT_715431 [Xylariales sp. AK1849]
MVSLFGLKFGGRGDKNKKRRATEKSASKRGQIFDGSELGEGQAFGSHAVYGGSYSASVSSLARPGSSRSHRLAPDRRSRHFYASDTRSLATSSMVDLSRPDRSLEPSLMESKPTASNPHLGMRWNNGSTSTLGAPPVLGSRPSTPVNQKPRVTPLDIQISKAQSSAPIVKSPLSQGVPSSHAGDDVFLIPNLEDSHPLPRPLQIRKQTPSPAPPLRSAARNPPSPPRSIKSSEETDSMHLLQRPVLPAIGAEARPSSRSSLRPVPTQFDDITFGHTPIPSPPLSLPRASDESSNRASMNAWGQPVIQNVRAKRETMTVSASRRRSLEKMIDHLEHSLIAINGQRPTTSSNPRHTKAECPTPMNLDLRPSTPERSEPRSAPFGMPQGAVSPRGGSSMTQSRIGPRAAFVDVPRRPMRPNMDTVPRPAADGYACSLGHPSEDNILVQSFEDSIFGCQSEDDILDRQSEDSSIYNSNLDSPSSPGSPVIPLTGPLASPRFPPPAEASCQALPKELNSDFRFPGQSASLADAPKPQGETVEPTMITVTPLYESVNWPLPASGINAPEAPSLLPARPQSPFCVPSFSRPWTPTNLRPGTPVKTTELTMPTGLRGPAISPRMPPPRMKFF